MQFNNSTQQKMKTKNMTTPSENPLTRRIPKEGKIMSKSTLKLLPVLIVAIITALESQSAFGHELVLTELSSTTLTAKYDGSTSRTSVFQQQGFPDLWVVTVSSATFDASFSTSIGTGWIEPENNSLFNTITAVSNLIDGTATSARVTFLSDTSFTTHPPLANDSALNNFGTDIIDGGTINLTFNDRGDVAAAPDTGTTFSLLALSLTGLGFLRRKLG
jgi:hypothetical protein